MAYRTLAVSVLVLMGVSVFGETWQIRQIPADLDKGRQDMCVVAGYCNPIAFVLQTTPENCRRDQDLVIEFVLPIGFDVIDSARGVDGHRYTRAYQDGALVVTDSFRHNRHQLTPLGSRPSEWRTYKIALRVPADVKPGSRLTMRLHHQGRMEVERTWDIRFTRLEGQDSPPLRKLVFGFYDYGYNGLKNAADDILNLFQAVGVNQFRVLNTRQRPPNFIWLSSVHHDFFHSRQHPNISVGGEPSKGGFCDPEAVIAEGATAVIPKAIERLVQAVDSSPSQAVYIDYEPTGITGFSERSIQKFMSEHQVSADDFARFREAYAREKHQVYRVEDAVVQAVYSKWTAFNTRQSAEYIGAIARDFKARRPEAQFWVTQSCTCGMDDKTRALGNDNSAMAAYLDGVLPQIYCGYGATAAKRSALVVEGWRRQINRLNPSCRLVPLLLNRYAGASVKNSPEMVRLQGLAAVASGADGVSYYFVQNFDGDYYPQLLRMRQDMARYEDFYVDGKRVDDRFDLSEMGEGKVPMHMWPGVSVEVPNPGWHYTAHQLNGKILLTLFNFDKDNELLFKVKTSAQFESAENCTWNKSAALVTTAEAAFLIFAAE